MFRHSLGRIEAGVNDRLAKNGVDPNDLPDLQNFFSSVKYPFQHLHSTYLQEKFYHQEFGCIVSGCCITKKKCSLNFVWYIKMLFLKVKSMIFIFL